MIFLHPINSPWGKEKDTIKGIIKICSRPPHQKGHALGDQEESKKQATHFSEEQKGCTCTNAVGEGPNGKHSKDLMLKSKPKPLGGKGGKEEIKEPKEPFGGRTWYL